MDPLTLHYDPAAITAKTHAIHQAMLAQSQNIRDPNFEVIAGRDVAVLFNLYDKQFFNGWLAETEAASSPQPMRFRVSSRMTKAGGKTTRSRLKQTGRDQRDLYEIAVAAHLLFLSFEDIARPIRIGGLECLNRLEALQRIMEHEIIHLVELLEWGESSCSQPRFKTLIQNIFGHTEVRHDLITPAEDAAVRHQVVVGSTVRFEHEGRPLTGRVNRINQRATVLVESKEGQRYSDGKRYAKYYVPLNCLAAKEVSQAS